MVLAAHCALKQSSDILASPGTCPRNRQGTAEGAHPHACFSKGYSYSSTAPCTPQQHLWGSKTHTGVPARTHTHAHVHTNTNTNAHVYKHRHAHKHTDTCASTHTHPQTPRHTRARTHENTHTHSHAHMHMHACNIHFRNKKGENYYHFKREGKLVDATSVLVWTPLGNHPPPRPPPSAPTKTKRVLVCSF